MVHVYCPQQPHTTPDSLELSGAWRFSARVLEHVWSTCMVHRTRIPLLRAWSVLERVWLERHTTGE